MDTFALSNGVGELFHESEKVLSFAIGIIIGIGNVANLLAHAVADPQRSIASTGNLGQGLLVEEVPRKVALVDPAFTNTSNFIAVLLVAFVSSFYGSEGWFFEEESVLGIDGVSFAKTTGSNVVTEEVGKGRHEVA